MKTLTLTPRFSETDALGHINNTSIATWFEVARLEFMSSLMDVRDAPGWVLASVKIDYRRENFFGSDVTLEIAPIKVGSSSLTLGCRMYQNGNLTVTCEGVLVHFDNLAKASMPIGDALRAALEAACEPDFIRSVVIS